MKKLLSLCLAVCLALVPAFGALAEASSIGIIGGERIRMLLSDGLSEVQFLLGLDESGLPGLSMQVEDEYIALSGDGLTMRMDGESMGLSFETLYKAFLLSTLGVETLPAFSGEEQLFLMEAAQRLFETAFSRVVTVEETGETAENRKTTITIHPKAFMEDLDRAVNELLSENSEELDAFFSRNEALLANLFAVSGGPLTSEWLLSQWKSLRLGSLLPVELPLTLAISSVPYDYQGWLAEASFPGVNANLKWQHSQLSGELDLLGQKYAFDTLDLQKIVGLLGDAFVKLPADVFRLEDGRFSLRLYMNPIPMLDALFAELKTIVENNADDVQALLDRYMPWAGLFGASGMKTTADLAKLLETPFSVRVASNPGAFQHATDWLYNPFELTFVTGYSGGAGMNLSAGLYDVSFYLEEEAVSLSVMNNDEQLFSLSGMAGSNGVQIHLYDGESLSSLSAYETYDGFYASGVLFDSPVMLETNSEGGQVRIGDHSFSLSMSRGGSLCLSYVNQLSQVRSRQESILLTQTDGVIELKVDLMNTKLTAVVTPVEEELPENAAQTAWRWKIKVTSDTETQYEGVLAVTMLDDGVRLELTSESHEPYACTLTVESLPFAPPADDAIYWLSVEECAQTMF